MVVRPTLRKVSAKFGLGAGPPRGFGDFLNDTASPRFRRLYVRYQDSSSTFNFCVCPANSILESIGAEGYLLGGASVSTITERDAPRASVPWFIWLAAFVGAAIPLAYGFYVFWV
jgi:hypothetical protein